MCRKRLHKFLCCLPLWQGFFLAIISFIQDACIATFIMKSPGATFSCIVVTLIFAFLPINKSNLCYRYIVLLVFIIQCLLQISIITIMCLQNDAKEFNEVMSEEKCDTNCRLWLEWKFYAFCIVTFFLLTIKVYAGLIIYSFARELHDRIYAQRVIVEGEVAKVNIGEAVLENESIVDFTIGVPHDADDEEKDNKMGQYSLNELHLSDYATKVSQ